LRFLVRLVPPPGRSNELNLNTVRSLARNLGIEVRNPKWTSYGALEVDIFAPSKGDSLLLETTLKPLMKVEFWRNLDELPRFTGREEVVEEAKSYFNAERFWESHETLEGLWRLTKGEEKELQQGLILVAAAYVHLQKDEPEVALGILRRALQKLRWSERYYLGIDVDAVRTHVEQALREERLEIFRI
jgi:uncharacterized protein